MAFELLSIISPYNYTNNVIHLTSHDILDQSAFHIMEISKTHWLNLKYCYRYSKPNPQQLCEMFTLSNNEDAEDVRKDICSRLKNEGDLYSKVGTVHLLMLKMNFDTWLADMEKNEIFGDVLLLYGLARTFQRHVVVLCADRCWSTVGMNEPIDSTRLMDICHMKLVYVGDNMFRELRQKTSRDTVFPGMNLDIQTQRSSMSVSPVLGTNREIDYNDEPVNTLDYCVDADDSENDTNGTLSADPADRYILSSIDELTSSDHEVTGDNTESPQSKSVNVIGTNNKVKSLEILDECVNGSNIAEITRDVRGLNAKNGKTTSVAVNGIKTGEQVKGVTGLNNDELSESPHVVNGLNTDRITPVMTGTNTSVNQNVTWINTPELPQTVHTITQDANDSSQGSEIPPDIEEPIQDESPSVSGIAAAETDLIVNSSLDTIGDLFFVHYPEKALYNMWKKDATTRKPMVNVFRMDKDYIYTMSKSKPNWSDIDPYSSLEEVSSSDTVVYETEKASQDKPTKGYQLRE